MSFNVIALSLASSAAEIATLLTAILRALSGHSWQIAADAHKTPQIKPRKIVGPVPA
jgi:hypothetical protein